MYGYISAVYPNSQYYRKQSYYVGYIERKKCRFMFKSWNGFLLTCPAIPNNMHCCYVTYCYLMKRDLKALFYIYLEYNVVKE